MHKTDIERIQGLIEGQISAEIHPDDTQAVKQKLSTLSTLLSTGSQCIAQAKKQVLLIRREWLRQHGEKISNYSPSVVKEYLNTACIDEEILFVRCERNYSALVHCIDALRSLLSIAKAELSL